MRYLGTYLVTDPETGDDIQAEVWGSPTRGCAGTFEDPPEPPGVEDLELRYPGTKDVIPPEWYDEREVINRWLEQDDRDDPPERDRHGDD